MSPSDPALDPALGLVLDLLSRGLPATLRARGASMRPFVCDGDVLTLAPASRFERGEVVAAGRGGALRLHRIVALEAGRALLRGDALAQVDGWFELSELAASVVALRRRDRSWPRWTWSGALPLLLSPASRALLRARARLRSRPISGDLPA